MRIARLMVAFLVLVAGVAQAQSPNGKAKRKQEKKLPARPTPTIENFVYANDSPRQVMDLWLAPSDEPTPVVLLIHGGGWRAGDKESYGTSMIEPFLSEGISVAAINYRFIEQAMEQKVEPPVMACLHDAARALQTIRFKHKEWNIDKSRIGATGGSAGACTSLWLALHDDLADAKNEDPILRESSRLTCAAVLGAQTSLDPEQLRAWMPNAVYGGHAFGFAGENRSRADEFELLVTHRSDVLPWIKEYSPIELVSKDDPPIYLAYPNQKTPPVVGENEPDPTHSAIYGLKLEEKLKEAGVEVIVSYPDHDDEPYKSIPAFLIAKLKQP